MFRLMCVLFLSPQGVSLSSRIKKRKILKWMDRIGVDSSEDEEEKTTKRKEVKEMKCT